MGFFVTHPIQKYVETYNLDTFIETGTFIGSGVGCARYFDFKEIYSIEISPKLAADAAQMFAIDLRVKIIEGHSPTALEELLPKLQDKKILFWLDSHFPDKYDDTVEIDSLEKIIPLKKELDLIKKYRTGNDVIIIDDARVYETGNYEYGNYTERELIGSPSMEFIFDFEQTHEILKSDKHEGYFILLPRPNVALEEVV